MRTNALLKLHQRQVDILDMIITCNNRIANAEAELRMIKAETRPNVRDWHDFMQLGKSNELSIKKHTAIRNRLIAYYRDVQERINKLYPETFYGQETVHEAHALTLTDNIS